MAEGLSFALMHGESLVAAATWALSEAGAELYDDTLDWSWVVASGRDVVLHDLSCPATPPGFIAGCIERLAELRGERAVVAFRPVTDTVKALVGSTDGARALLGETVDRDGLRQLASPIVLPAALTGQIEPTDPLDLAGVVAQLGVEIEWVEAPVAARRISAAGELSVVEALG